jgi:hypothetical protein
MTALHLMPSACSSRRRTFQSWIEAGAIITTQFNPKNPVPTRLVPTAVSGNWTLSFSRRAQRAVHQTRSAATYPPSGVSGAR